MSSSCNIPELNLVESFIPPEFVNTQSIRWTHENAPRFGHSSDLLLLMQGTPEEQKDYLKGLMASSIAMFCFFLVWMIFLVVFKCMGPKEMGILSGKARPLPPQPPEGSEELEAWQQRRANAERRLGLIRVLICICGLFIIISSCLMAVKGVSSLTQSLNDGTQAIAISQNLANRAIKLIDRVTIQNNKTAKAVDELLVDLNGICPLQRPDGLCTDLNNVSTCSFGDVLDSDILEQTVKHFKSGDQSIYFQQLFDARTDLQNFLALTDELNDHAESFNWALYAAMLFSLALTVVCVLIIFGMTCRSSRILKCLQHFILAPIFTILVILSFVFAMLFVLGSMSVADLCYNSPDSRILVILNRFTEQISPLGVKVASFYIQACPKDAVPQEVATQLDFVLQAIPTLGNFSSLVTTSASNLQAVCGFDDSSGLASAAELANGQLCEIVDILNAIRLFFQCENWFPLYETTVYDAICYNGTDGFAWVASTQFVIVFLSCIVLTLRAAFYDLEIAEGDGKANSRPTIPESETKVLSGSDGDEFELAWKASSRY